jgi:hypothetical protein
MRKIPCLYSIVRFAPFVETGEFANVGVIMIAPEQRFFDFKLLIQRHSRITHFFEQLEPKVYRATMRNLREELARVAGLLRQHGFDRRLKVNDVEFAKGLFAEIIRPRETVIKFGEPRVVLAEDMGATLEELYGFYVERNFVTREYQEAVLERGLRRWLYQARIVDRFARQEVGDEEYHVAFPFVERRDDHPVKAIKPLHLAHNQPSKILDHGGQWLFRVGQLKRRNLLPERMLFAVQGPTADGARERAYREIVDSLRDTGAEVLPYADKEHILRFAD